MAPPRPVDRPGTHAGMSLLPVALPVEVRFPVPPRSVARQVRSAGHTLGSYPAPDRDPAFVDLAGFADGSRRTMRQALDVIAAFVAGGRADAATLPWHQFRSADETAQWASVSP